ncbi:MAG: iron-sulfur cluster assembly protein, partial [Siculibacillus sp.]
MSLTVESVLSALSGLAGPDGVTPLNASPALSDVVVDGDRVYFSIAVDPARAEEME